MVISSTCSTWDLFGVDCFSGNTDLIRKIQKKHWITLRVDLDRFEREIFPRQIVLHVILLLSENHIHELHKELMIPLGHMLTETCYMVRKVVQCLESTK